MEHLTKSPKCYPVYIMLNVLGLYMLIGQFFAVEHNSFGVFLDFFAHKHKKIFPDFPGNFSAFSRESGNCFSREFPGNRESGIPGNKH